jgi:hypothetical protein
MTNRCDSGGCLVADQLRSIPTINAATVNPDIVMAKPYVKFEVIGTRQLDSACPP